MLKDTRNGFPGLLEHLATYVTSSEFLNIMKQGDFGYCLVYQNTMLLLKTLMLRKSLGSAEIQGIFRQLINYKTLSSVLEVLNDKLTHEERMKSMTLSERNNLLKSI